MRKRRGDCTNRAHVRKVGATASTAATSVVTSRLKWEWQLEKMTVYPLSQHLHSHFCVMGFKKPKSNPAHRPHCSPTETSSSGLTWDTAHRCPSQSHQSPELYNCLCSGRFVCKLSWFGFVVWFWGVLFVWFFVFYFTWFFSLFSFWNEQGCQLLWIDPGHQPNAHPALTWFPFPK